MDSAPRDVVGAVGEMLLDGDLANFCLTQKFVARAVGRVLRERAARHLAGLVGGRPSTIPDGLAIAFVRPFRRGCSEAEAEAEAEAEKDMLRHRSTLVSLLRGVSVVELDSVFRRSHGCCADGFVAHMARYMRAETLGRDAAPEIARVLTEVRGFRYGVHRDEWGRSTSSYLRAKIRVNVRPDLRGVISAILAVVDSARAPSRLKGCS